MKPRLALAALVPIVLMALAPAASAAGERSRSDSDVAFDSAPAGSPFGLFLAGRAAMADGQNDLASSYFDRAAATGLDASLIRDRAFIAAVMAGDVAKASRLAPSGEGVDPFLQSLGALSQLVEAIAQGDGATARDLIGGGRVSSQRQAAALLAPWAAAAGGDKQGALVQPALRGDRLVPIFGQLGQALLFERARRYDEAETDYKALAGMGDIGALFTVDYGSFLERRGRWGDALAVYDAALAQSPRDVALRAARARALTRRNAPALPTVREGAARALLPAAITLASERQAQLSIAYLRMVLYLDPRRDDARLMLGDALSSNGDVEAAREAFLTAPEGSPQYAAARSKLAWTYQAARDGETALRLAREALDAVPESDEAAITYADLLRANERYAESAAVLDRVVARAGANPDWRLLYMRGVALERAGRWPEAERDLTTALAAQPGEPELLNYLGYSWIDRGERLAEAMDMVKRAVASNPRSGAMIDSLGWAYYRLGDYRNAVEKLEEAVQLEPADPEINNHLGDAYWRVGRTIEAGFQWNRTLGLEPSETIRREAETKLKSGLGPAAPVVAGR